MLDSSDATTDVPRYSYVSQDGRLHVHWRAIGRHGLQTLGFCLLIICALRLLFPMRSLMGHVIYPLCIGTTTFVLIEWGRHLRWVNPRLYQPTVANIRHDWPANLRGLALVMVSIALGYMLGTLLADFLLGYNSFFADSLADRRMNLVITAIAGTTISYFFYSKGKAALYLEQIAQTQRQASEAQLKLLQSQLEPHMLFNTLANLRALIATDPTRAIEMLDRLNNFLRATLSASRVNQHPLRVEFDRLRDYLELMVVRMGPRLRYTLDLPEALAESPLPPLLLQPLVENSIIHGLEPLIGGGRIAISARREGSQLVLEIVDSGCGYDMASVQQAASPTADVTGFGLHQVRERLDSSYGGAARLQVVSACDQGCRTTIRLPL